MLHETKPTPNYINALYDMVEDATGDKEIKEIFNDSWLSGGTEEGVSNALGELCRTETHLEVDNPKLFIASTILNAQLDGWHNEGNLDHLLPPPKFGPMCYEMVEVPKDKAAGMTVAIVEQSNPLPGIVIHYSNVTKKGIQHQLAADTCHRIDNIIRHRYRSGIMTIDVSIYPANIVVPEIKVEATRDKTKNRVFYNVPMFSFLIEKYILEPIFNFIRGRGQDGIGIKWWSGDAQRIYNQVKNNYQYFAETDLSRQDQTEKAIELVHQIASLIMFFRPGRTEEEKENYHLLRHHLYYICYTSAIKIIQWPDGHWRLVPGTMSSGRYITGLINTRVARNIWNYNALKQSLTLEPRLRNQILESFHVQILSSREMDSEIAHNILKNSKIFLIVGGDNYLYGSSAELQDYVNLATLYDTATREFKKTIKWKNCNESTQLTTPIDPSTGLPRDYPWNSPDGTEDFAKPLGPNFFKHYFVKRWLDDGTQVIVPYRDKRDYYYRIGRATADVDNPIVQLARIHGLMLGSMGANEHLYKLLETFADKLIQLSPNIEEEIKTLDIEKHPVLKELKQKIMYSGIGIISGNDFLTRPKFSTMSSKLISNTLYHQKKGNYYFVPVENRTLLPHPL